MAAPLEVAITEIMLEPIAYLISRPNSSVKAGVTIMPPPRPNIAPTIPARIAMHRISTVNVTMCANSPLSVDLSCPLRCLVHSQLCWDAGTFIIRWLLIPLTCSSPIVKMCKTTNRIPSRINSEIRSERLYQATVKGLTTSKDSYYR